METCGGYLKECLNGGWIELSQEGNLNANARLFRKAGTVRKIYTDNAESNIKVILALSLRKDLESVPELILPSRILRENGIITGYEMPWADGRTWTEVRGDSGISFGEKLRLLENAADALRRFPRDLIWGDVHGNNLLVCEEGIRIADPDGLGLSSPQEILLDELPGRYRGKDGHIRISRDTDILGLCVLGLELLLDGRTVADDFYRGEAWEIGLKRWDFPKVLLLRVFAMQQGAPVFTDEPLTYENGSHAGEMEGPVSGSSSVEISYTNPYITAAWAYPGVVEFILEQ